MWVIHDEASAYWLRRGSCVGNKTTPDGLRPNQPKPKHAKVGMETEDFVVLSPELQVVSALVPKTP